MLQKKIKHLGSKGIVLFEMEIRLITFPRDVVENG
jgi:hypothetical protein